MNIRNRFQSALFNIVRLIGVFVIIALFIVPGTGHAQQNFLIRNKDVRNGNTVSVQTRPGDEVWLVSSRHLDDQRVGVDQLRFWKAEDNCWIRCCADEFYCDELRTDPTRQTVVAMHGHLTNFDFAQFHGWQAYQRLIGNDANSPSVRLVIWAWPSEFLYTREVQRRTSYKKSDVHAFFLAKFMQRCRCEVPLSLLAHSYGSRVVLGALQLLSGGRLMHHRLESVCPANFAKRYRVTLVEPAVLTRRLHCGYKYAFAFKSISSFLLIRNRHDPALRVFRASLRTGVGRVLGRSGIDSSICCSSGTSIRQFDAEQLVGRKHDLYAYLKFDHIVNLLRSNLYDQPLQALATPFE